MKIGINASFLRKPNSGIGQVTAGFLQKLIDEEAKKTKQKNNYEFIVYLEEALPEGFRLPKNFKTRVFLPIYRRDDLIRKIWWERFLLPKKIKVDRCDVFFSLYQSPTILSGKIRHLMLVHDIIPSLFPEYLDNLRKKIYQKLTELAIKKADRIMVVSNHTEKDLIRKLFILAEKISLNYISINEVYKKNASNKNCNAVLRKHKLDPGYIFAGGGMEKRKNIDGVIRAYRVLLEKNKKEAFVDILPELVIYGKELLNLTLVINARSLIKELGLTKHIKLLGEISQKEMPALFKSALFFIYPSHYEGFGMPVLESMSQGTPVITAKNSSLLEVGLDSVLYCHSHDIVEIACIMKKVIINKSLRETLSKKGSARVKNFSWEKFIKKFYHIIENDL